MEPRTEHGSDEHQTKTSRHGLAFKPQRSHVHRVSHQTQLI